MSARFHNVRLPAVAGSFYPADSAELRAELEGFLADAPPDEGAPPKALIAPHAGYLYSGPIAASAYASWQTLRNRVQRVVLIGPAHYVAFKGVASCTWSAFATPLGEVSLDAAALERLSKLPQVQPLDAAHKPEHSLEVQLPFLQLVLGKFALVPLLAGDTTPGALSEVIDELWGGPETRLVISSDLSHYHDSLTAQTLDRQTATAIEALDPAAIAENQACGHVPLLGLLQSARVRQLRARTLDLRNSGDTAGPRDQVVGYGAFALYE